MSLSQEDVDKVRAQVKIMMDFTHQDVRALLVAHGAGIAGCVAALKDYATIPALKGIGVFIYLFSIGFMAAMVTLCCLGLYQTSVVQNTLTPDKINTRHLSVGLWFANISAGFLCAALLSLINRFGSL